MIQYHFKSQLGSLYLVASQQGLTGVYFSKQNIPLTRSLAESPILRLATQELEEYFSKKRRSFSVSLDLKGTPFQIRVWKQLLKTPYGSTLSYKEIAQKIKNPKAARAVGTANKRNPVCIIVPCHRIVATTGIGGYSGGLHRKKFLLRLESLS